MANVGDGNMRIALVSTGCGRIVRGFESHTESLYRALLGMRPDVPVTLFQSVRGEAGRVGVPNLHRADAPARWFGEWNGNLLEKRSFALALYPMLRAGGYSVVHYNELAMGSALFHLRRALGGSFRLLYCNGAPSPPMHYEHRCDFAQMLTGPMSAEAVEYGLSQDRLFVLPYGVDATRFVRARSVDRGRIREKLGIPQSAIVVLSVAALKREHKRIDHILSELRGLGQDIWFVAAGQRTSETEDLEKMAEEALPGRWRFLSVGLGEVHQMYRAADVFVHAAVTEGLGLVLVEAMLSELPVILHNGPVFQWVARDYGARFIDMAQPGALSAEVASVLRSAPVIHRKAAVDRFSWDSLVSRYVEMFAEVSRTPVPETSLRHAGAVAQG